jgi:hypothetical protein
MLGIVLNTRDAGFQDQAAGRPRRPVRLSNGLNRTLSRTPIRGRRASYDNSELSLGRPAQRPGKGAAGALPRRRHARDHGKGLVAAGIRRQRARPRFHAQSASRSCKPPAMRSRMGA